MLLWRAVSVFAFSLLTWGQSAPVAFTGAKIIPVDGPEIVDGTVVVAEGKIVAVGFPERRESWIGRIGDRGLVWSAGGRWIGVLFQQLLGWSACMALFFVADVREGFPKGCCG